MEPIQTISTGGKIHPLVSVKMITYNHAPYIRQAVEGVLSQKADFPFELVIGEDYSTDGTRDIVFDYQRRFPDFIRVVTSDRNVGMHANSSRTQAACRSAYIAYCEGDDYWHGPAKLAKQVEFLESHPEYGMTHTNYDVYEVARQRRHRAVINDPGNLDDADAYRDILRRRRQILTLTVCGRTSLIKKALEQCPECTDERWPMGDTQLWFELARMAPVKFFPESTATYQVLPESASNSQNRDRALKFRLKAGQLILHYLDKYPVDPALDRYVRRRTYKELMAMAFSAEDRTAADNLMRGLKNANCGIPLDAGIHWWLTGRRAMRPVAMALDVALRLRRKMDAF